MRKYFEAYSQNPIDYGMQAKMAGLAQAEKFSYEVVGQLMKDILND